MTMRGGSGSKTSASTAAAAKSKGRLKSLRGSKSLSSVDRRSSDDSEMDGSKIVQNQRKKIMAVNAFGQDKSKNAGKAPKANRGPPRTGPKEGKTAQKSNVTKTAGKLMAAASKSKAMASTSNNTKNVNAAGAKPRMFVRHNSTPAVIPLDKKGVTRKSALKSSPQGTISSPETGRPQRKKSASAEHLPSKSAKSVRIDDVVEVRTARGGWFQHRKLN